MTAVGLLMQSPKHSWHSTSVHTATHIHSLSMAALFCRRPVAPCTAAGIHCRAGPCVQIHIHTSTGCRHCTQDTEGHYGLMTRLNKALAHRCFWCTPQPRSAVQDCPEGQVDARLAHALALGDAVLPVLLRAARHDEHVTSRQRGADLPAALNSVPQHKVAWCSKRHRRNGGMVAVPAGPVGLA